MIKKFKTRPKPDLSVVFFDGSNYSEIIPIIEAQAPTATITINPGSGSNFPPTIDVVDGSNTATMNVGDAVSIAWSGSVTGMFLSGRDITADFVPFKED